MSKFDKELEEFIQKELEDMCINIATNYKPNIENRKNNPFLCFEDTHANKYMGLGRSIDSQLGNRIQRIIFYIARQRYGLSNVPNIISINYYEKDKKIICKLFSINIDLPTKEQNKNFNPFKQIIYVNKGNIDESEVKKELKIKSTSKSLIIKQREIHISDTKFLGELSKFIKKNNGNPVDLLFFDCNDKILDNVNAFEIKMGGNLDTKNAEANANEVKNLKKIFSFFPNNYSYFATCYSNCSKAVEIRLCKNQILNNVDFWNKILPSEIPYDNFIKIYTSAFKKAKVEEKIQKM